MKGTIYRIHCTHTDRSYIGQTRQSVNARWGQHRQKLKAGKHTSNKLQADWRKYGPDAFEFSVIETCPLRLLNARERHWIGRHGFYNEQHNSLYRGNRWGWWERWIATLVAALAVVLIWSVMFN